MRKTIRLSGRRQLQKSHFDILVASSGKDHWVELSISPEWDRSIFSPDAEIRLKLVENKLVEILRFGTVGQSLSKASLCSQSFRAPSCQIRVVSREPDTDGLLLASTNSWTLKSEGDPEGILLFQAASISPRLWKLEIRSDEHPVLYIDEQVPNAALWAKSDPFFTACVLPQVASLILKSVLDGGEPPDDGWESDWISWAQSLCPGCKPPFSADEDERLAWIDDVVDAFCKVHNFLGSAVEVLEAK